MWRTSRQVCSLCRWEKHLTGFPHLGVKDKWAATRKRARIAHWSLSRCRRINMQLKMIIRALVKQHSNYCVSQSNFTHDIFYRYYCPENSSDYISNECPPGYYCPNGTKNANDYPCPAGTFSDAYKLPDLRGCKPCTPGKEFTYIFKVVSVFTKYFGVEFGLSLTKSRFYRAGRTYFYCEVGLKVIG